MKDDYKIYKKMVIMEKFDSFFQFMALIYPLPWIMLAIKTIWCNGFFSYVRLPFFPFPFVTYPLHSLTTLIITSFYYYTFYQLNYLLTYIRVPVAIAFTVLGFLFYDFVWIVCEYLTTGHGVVWVPLVPVLGTCIPLVYYCKKYDVFILKKRFVVLLGSFLFFMIWLSLSGFFQQIHAYEMGGSDPHNWVWFVGKWVGVWMWSGLYQKRGGLEIDECQKSF